MRTSILILLLIALLLLVALPLVACGPGDEDDEENTAVAPDDWSETIGNMPGRQDPCGWKLKECD